MWYADLIGYFATGKFPVGVAKYVTWPETHWTTKFTCTHHLWTMPVLIYGAHGLHWAAYPLSIYIVIIHVLLSSWMTPPVLVRKDNTVEKYMNINLSHHLWKDIKFEFLQIEYDKPSKLLYLFRLLWRWQALNLIVFLGLYPLCLYCFPKALINSCP